MVCDRLLSTKVNRLCDKEDTDLRQERLNKVKTGFTRLHGNFGSTVRQEKQKDLDLKRLAPKRFTKVQIGFLCA